MLYVLFACTTSQPRTYCLIFEVQDMQTIHTILELYIFPDSGIRFCYSVSVYFVQFDVARRKAELQDKLTSLKFMLSEASLQLLPEYKQRIQVRSCFCLSPLLSEAGM